MNHCFIWTNAKSFGSSHGERYRTQCVHLSRKRNDKAILQHGNARPLEQCQHVNRWLDCLKRGKVLLSYFVNIFFYNKSISFDDKFIQISIAKPLSICIISNATGTKWFARSLFSITLSIRPEISMWGQTPRLNIALQTVWLLHLSWWNQQHKRLLTWNTTKEINLFWTSSNWCWMTI